MNTCKQLVTMNFYLSLCLSVLLLVTANLLLKKAALVAFDASFFAILENYWFLTALLCFFLSSLTWIHTLKGINLSKAYPCLAASYILTPLAAAYFFEEKISFLYIIALICIFCGIILVLKK